MAKHKLNDNNRKNRHPRAINTKKKSRLRWEKDLVIINFRSKSLCNFLTTLPDGVKEQTFVTNKPFFSRRGLGFQSFFRKSEQIDP